jgi:hypothetical protein
MNHERDDYCQPRNKGRQAERGNYPQIAQIYADWEINEIRNAGGYAR